MHIDYENNEIVLAKHTVDGEDIQFNTSQSNVKYSNSNLASKCDEFLDSLPVRTKNELIAKTVHGVSAKVWIPQINWITTRNPGSQAGTNNTWTQFDYFTDNASLMVFSSSGYEIDWWTASADSSNTIYSISNVGSIKYNSPTASNGFRPFVCVPLS